MNPLPSDSHTGIVPPDVLLVEDEDGYADELGEYLQNHGLTSTRISRLDRLCDTVQQIAPRVVALDQFVHGVDALVLLPQLRAVFAGGIVLLTGNSDQTDRGVGLELGADDFIVKTQPPREILARLRAVIRRSAAMPAPDIAAPAQPAESEDGPRWRIDLERRALFAPDGTPVHLTSTEFELLAFLSPRIGRPASRAELYDAILRRAPTGPEDRAIDNLVSRVRAALAPFLHAHNPIRSMRGIGYVFVGLDVATDQS